MSLAALAHQFLSEMSPAEGIASLLLLVNVWLVARRSIWNYGFGIAGVAIYGWVFFGAKLYSDMLLQGFFLVVQLYGWREWLRSAQASGEVEVEWLSWRARGAWLAGIAVAAGTWGTLMHRYTDAAFPWWDAGVAMASVAAQILQSRREIESWVLWIAVDVAAIPLYAAKALWITAALYTVFLALSVWGLVEWRRKLGTGWAAADPAAIGAP